jgi:predicted ATPase
MLTRVTIENFKSIAFCDVKLGPLTFLVGLNGAGKSNFIDALRFCRDALRGPLDQAFASRSSNLQNLSHIGAGSSPGFGLRVEMQLSETSAAHYAFAIRPQSPRGFSVHQEECVVKDLSTDAVLAYFAVSSGIVRGHNFQERPAPTDSRLYLVHASGASPFRLVYDALEGMEFYSPDPEIMKAYLDTSGPADVLESDGSNLASVFGRIGEERPEMRRRIEEYMQRIVPGLRGIGSETIKTFKLLSFEQGFEGNGSRTFTANSMSDGTLRALAILVALFQRSDVGSKPTMVAIEEPETGLHPAGAGILLDALREGATRGQVIVTSHSPDLLDNRAIMSEWILAVDASHGSTMIAPLDAAGRSTLRDRLYTAGELLRMDQLKPEINGTLSRPLFDAPFV